MLSELERKQIANALEPMLVRRGNVVKSGSSAFRLQGNEVVLFTHVPSFRNPAQEIEIPVAKFKRVNTTGFWHLYWMRASGKWQGYEPLAQAESFQALAARLKAILTAAFGVKLLNSLSPGSRAAGGLRQNART